MELENLKPRQGNDTYRIGDSDDLVLMENVTWIPSDNICLQDHGVIILCMAGKIRFEYDGTEIQLQKNDMFLYMVNSVVSNFMISPDFNCRQIWFTRSELFNINIYNGTSLSDMAQLKLHPVIHFTADDVALFDTYFKLLCRKMSDCSSLLQADIVRSLLGTLMLELLSMMRRPTDLSSDIDHSADQTPNFHKKRIIDQFMSLLEQSDGRIRRVDVFASQLNITPRYLSAILKEVMNRRPSVYIQLFTMKAIEHRLRFTEMTMQEIAYDLRFPNASFFGKYFKEHTGMTPLEYRMKYHNGVDNK
jgi:AraC-like DNA-binding protein